MLTGLLLFNALAALTLAAVLLRAKHCWENQMLALALLLDAASAGHLSWLVMVGQSIASREALYGMLLSKVLVVYPLLEFAYAFPFGRRPSRVVRIIGLSATALEVAFVLHPRTSALADTWLGRLAYFLPFAAATLTVMLRNLRELGARAAEIDMRGARAVLAAICYRWVTEFVLFVVIRPVWPDLFPVALLNHGTISVLGSYIVIAHAVLVYHCLRVGDLIARTTLHSLLLFASIALVIEIEGVLAAQDAGPMIRSLALGGLVLFFWMAWAAARQWGPKIESVVLGSLDPRRVERNTVLEQTLQKLAKLTSAAEITEVTTAAIARLNGGRVQFHGAASGGELIAGREPPRILAGSLEAALREPDVTLLTREQSLRLLPAACDAFAALGADVLLPVRAEGKLLGALSLHELPRLAPEMLETSTVLADNLAAKLLHHALYERAFELQKQLDQSRHLATLGSFAAAIAHDIRTPLTSVKMNLEMLRERIGNDEEGRECTALALEELARMNNYVSGMLDFVKPVQLNAVDASLPELIDDTAKLMQPLLESRKLRLVCDVPSSVAERVLRVDLLRLRQVMVNLVANAADASPAGATVRIVGRVCNAAGVSISVTDEGEGIAAADRERIFEPFFTTRVEGTGLGLAIVRKLVEAHAGTIEVESVVGAGSTFKVTLPTRSGSPFTSERVAGSQQTPAMESPRV
jgi:signal transduction histidine kinase